MDDHFDIGRVFEIGKFDITRLTCSRIQGLFKSLSDFPVLLRNRFNFQDFQEIPLNSSTFQACANPVIRARIHKILF